MKALAVRPLNFCPEVCRASPNTVQCQQCQGLHRKVSLHMLDAAQNPPTHESPTHQLPSLPPFSARAGKAAAAPRGGVDRRSGKGSQRHVRTAGHSSKPWGAPRTKGMKSLVVLSMRCALSISQTMKCIHSGATHPCPALCVLPLLQSSPTQVCLLPHCPSRLPWLQAGRLQQGTR